MAKRLYLRWTENKYAAQDIGDDDTGPVELTHNISNAMSALWFGCGLDHNTNIDVSSIRFSIEED